MNRVLFSFALLALSLPAYAQSVLTYHNDNARTGQNVAETILTPANVSSGQFGKLVSVPVDGQIYAQPLYVQNVTIAGTPHNVIIVATENNSLYAIDEGSTGGILWKASLVDTNHGAAPGATAMPEPDIACSDIQTQYGITSTPVIDASSGTIYVEAKSKENGQYFHRLHALDIITGNEKGSPTVITATVRGTGDASSNGSITFDPLMHMNRPALLLSNGQIYITYASHCDYRPYHGWVFAYDSKTLAQTAVFNTTPDGGLGGIWMSGAGPAADASGNIYVSTGNGTYDSTGVPDLGDSIVKLDPATLLPSDYFVPYNQLSLEGGDHDLGSGTLLLLPDQPGAHPHEMVTGSKEGVIYLLDRDQLTAGNQHYCDGCSRDSEVVQESNSGFTPGFFGAFAYWNSRIYYQGRNDAITSIPLSNGLLDFSHITKGATVYRWPNQVSISANGQSNGIAWLIDATGNADPGTNSAAILRAYDALSLNEIYNSAQATQDNAGVAIKFSVPTVASGHVYVGTVSELDVYGLLPVSSGIGTDVPSIATIVVTQ